MKYFWTILKILQATFRPFQHLSSGQFRVPTRAYEEKRSLQMLKYKSKEGKKAYKSLNLDIKYCIDLRIQKEPRFI